MKRSPLRLRSPPRTFKTTARSETGTMRTFGESKPPSTPFRPTVRGVLPARRLPRRGEAPAEEPDAHVRDPLAALPAAGEPRLGLQDPREERLFRQRAHRGGEHRPRRHHPQPRAGRRRQQGVDGHLHARCGERLRRAGLDARERDDRRLRPRHPRPDLRLHAGAVPHPLECTLGDRRVRGQLLD